MNPALSNLIESNEATIKELNDLLISIQKDISDFKNTESSCFDKLNELSNAWCRFPFGIYADVYFNTLKRPPSGSEFDVQIGSMGRQPSGWIQLTEAQKKKFEKGLPDTGQIGKILSETVGKLGPLIQNAIDKNVIIKNLENLDEEYVQLKKIEERWVYTKEEMIHKYIIKDIITSDMRMAQSGYKYAYHALLMAYYDSVYKTVYLIENKINSCVRILARINYNLPFAKIKGNIDETIEPSTAHSIVNYGEISLSNDKIDIHNVVGPVNVKAQLEKVTQTVNNAPGLNDMKKQELSALIEELKQALEPAASINPDDTDRVIEEAERVAKEVSREKPSKSRLESIAEDLKETAKAVQDVAPTVLPIATKIASFVTGMF